MIPLPDNGGQLYQLLAYIIFINKIEMKLNRQFEPFFPQYDIHLREGEKLE